MLNMVQGQNEIKVSVLGPSVEKYIYEQQKQKQKILIQRSMSYEVLLGTAAFMVPSRFMGSGMGVRGSPWQMTQGERRRPDSHICQRQRPEGPLQMLICRTTGR